MTSDRSSTERRALAAALLGDFIGSLTDQGRAPRNTLSINHDELRDLIRKSRQFLTGDDHVL